MPFGADDHMIMDGNSKPLARIRNFTRQGNIGAAWRGIPAWMVVDKYDRA